jgi:hypothetical protein
MKKIRLDADALEVISFTTDRTPATRGTVQGANTGNPCYVTVGYHQTQCLAYPVSYWQEYSCFCPMEPVTQHLRCQPIDTLQDTCLRCQPLDTVDPTCFGQPGC